MVVDIIVKRDNGDKAGEDIVVGIIGDPSAAIHIGRTQIDKEELGDLVTLRVPFSSILRPGRLIEVFNGLQGFYWRGKILSTMHYIKKGEAFTEITVDRPRRFL